MLRKFLTKVGLLSNDKPAIIPRSKHGISRKQISENALKVLYRLHQKGFEAYLVGGGVRDLLLGMHPKDFDVATNARPEQVAKIFHNCRLIGRRFRLAHIYFGRDIIEVATFRKQAVKDSEHQKTAEDHGMILRDNVYGNLQQDAWRRDFTVNALYYNIDDFSLVDHTGGLKDLKAKRLAMIGDADKRFREDPVRILRAIRFAAKLKLKPTKEILEPLPKLKHLIGNVPPARLFEEMIKLFHSGVAEEVYRQLIKHDLFAQLFPQTAECFGSEYPVDKFLTAVFKSTDDRVNSGKTVTPAFIIAALLWYPICLKTKEYKDHGMSFYEAVRTASDKCLKKQTNTISFPRRLSHAAREIWMLQMRLERRHGKRADRLMQEGRFKAAYDFLLLRSEAGEPVSKLSNWWQKYVHGNIKQKRELINALDKNNTTNNKSSSQKSSEV